MENFEYNKVFSENEKPSDADPDEMETMSDVLQRYERERKNKPKFLLPFAPALFEKTVADCERIAEEFSGRIKAKIDYANFEATIELWCCYVEFVRGEFMSILQEISHHAICINFTPLTSGELHIEVLMPYFLSAQSQENSG